MRRTGITSPLIRFSLMLLLAGLMTLSLLAQDDCLALVEEALEQTDRFCADIERNQVCYGYPPLTAEPQRSAGRLELDRPGDVADVGDMQTLTLNGMTLPDEWGVALLKIQANLPDSLPEQNVTLMLLGDVRLENDSDMNVFYFASGAGDSGCEDAPESGILIQTPYNAYETRLNINETEVTLDGTVFLQAEPGREMTLRVISGAAALYAAGEGVFAPEGTIVYVPLNRSGMADDIPSEPEPYDREMVRALPLVYLEQRVRIAPPPSRDDIEQIGRGMPVEGFWDIDFNEDSVGCPLLAEELTFNDYTKELQVINGGRQLRCDTCDYEYETTATAPGFHVYAIDDVAGDLKYTYREALHLTTPATLQGSRAFLIRHSRTGEECAIVTGFTGLLQD